MPFVQSATDGPLRVSLSSNVGGLVMRSCNSRKPALVRYVRPAIRWIKRAWDLYRLYEMVEALVDAVIE